MTFGPGKYDDVCTLVREQVCLDDARGGAVMVIVLNGNKGNGFSVQADPRTMLALPQILDGVLREMRTRETAIYARETME